MFNSSNGYSLSDIATATGATNRNAGIFGDDSGAWWIIILFLFCFAGGWGNGRGIFGNGSTGSGLTDGYILTSDFANIERKIDGVNNGICDGFYAMNTGMLNGFSGLNMSAMQNTNALTSQLTALGNQMSSCCCDQKFQSATQSADLNYRLAEQSCQIRQAVADATTAITSNQDANARMIAESIESLKTQALHDKIAELTAMNSELRFQASQAAQNTYLINALNPAPIPAYTVPNPNRPATCGCGTTTF